MNPMFKIDLSFFFCYVVGETRNVNPIILII